MSRGTVSGAQRIQDQQHRSGWVKETLGEWIIGTVGSWKAEDGDRRVECLVLRLQMVLLGGQEAGIAGAAGRERMLKS